MTHEEFIKKISKYICEYAPQYDILCPSAVIAQAILESGWGESVLAKEYNNYFGLKCGTLWKGPSVNLSTQEEFQPGSLTTIRDNFRVYTSMRAGVKGYFEFIQLDRYKNLRGVKDPGEYLTRIKNDGYATSSDYVKSCMRLVDDYDLRDYDPKADGGSDAPGEDSPATVTAQDAIAVARGWIGRNEMDGSHRAIIDIYNSHRPLARGYLVTYSDSWCDVTISAIFIALSAVDLIGGTECGVEEHIKLFKAAGIWEEDGTVTPESGWIITYNWDQSYQPNDGFADHIGIVEKVSGGVITVIEGNRSNAVKRVEVRVGDGNIRGYAKPKYGKVENAVPPQDEPSTDGTSSGAESGGGLSKTVRFYGKARYETGVYTWAGSEYDKIKSCPTLYYEDPVGICDQLKDSADNYWYYVRLDGKIYGFVESKTIEKA